MEETSFHFHLIFVLSFCGFNSLFLDFMLSPDCISLYGNPRAILLAMGRVYVVMNAKQPFMAYFLTIIFHSKFW